MSPPLLVTCEWLNEQISSGCKDADMVILDVSWSSTKNCSEEFQKQHIPGAQYLNVLDAEHTDIYPRNIPSVESFTDKAQKAGINASSRIVVYSNSDKAGYFLSGRGWWTLKYFGQKNVSILDGGLQRWLQLGFPTSEETTEPQKGNFVASIDSAIRTTFEDVRDNVDTERFQLIDTRPNSAYEEKNIPRAKNIEMGVLVDTENGTLKNKDELTNIFSAAGIDLNRPVVAHCNSGMSSCTVALVAQYLGAKDASVFHGGFNEWSKRTSDK